MTDAILKLGTFGSGMVAIYFISEYYKAGGSMLDSAGLAMLWIAATMAFSRARTS